MPAQCSSRTGLSDQMRTLSLLGADEAARQGLRALLREGRRCGLDTVEFAGVSLSSSTAAAAAVRLQSGNDSRQQAGVARKPRRKSDERRERDAERYREKRMRKKLFAVLPIVNAVMQNAAAAATSKAAAGTAGDSNVQRDATEHQQHDREELPQFREEFAPGALQYSQQEQHHLQGQSDPQAEMASIATPQQPSIQCQQPDGQPMDEGFSPQTPRGTQRERQSPGSGALGSGQSNRRAKKKPNFNAACCPYSAG